MTGSDDTKPPGETTPRTRFEPPPSGAGAPFWEATRRGELVLPWCRACDRPHWFPRDACPFCLAPELDWRAAAGTGVVYAVSVMPKPALPMLADRVPYAVAIVELDEGVRLMTNIETDAPYDVVVGARVRVAWEPLSDGRQLPIFAPDA